MEDFDSNASYFHLDGDDIIDYDKDYGNGNDAEFGKELPPPMPDGYYKDIDYFLNRPAPKLGISLLENCTLKSGLSKKSKPIKISASGTAGQSVMSSKKSGQTKCVVNERLLLEAFKYADRLARENMDEDMLNVATDSAFDGRYADRDSIKESNRRDARGSMVNAHVSTTQRTKVAAGATKSGKRSEKTVGLVNKLRSQTAAVLPSVFDTSSENADNPNINAKKMDMETLVANFEQGITLRKLQQELQNSRDSMAKSEQFMRQLSRDFSGIDMGSNLQKGVSGRKKKNNQKDSAI